MPSLEHLNLSMNLVYSYYTIINPTYCPDIAPNDCFLFPRIRKSLGDKRFHDANPVTEGFSRLLEELQKMDFSGCYINDLKD